MSSPSKELKRGKFLELRKPLKDPKMDLLKTPKPMDAKNCGPLSAKPDEAKPKTLNKIWSGMLMRREKGGGIFTLIHCTPDQFLLNMVQTSPISEREQNLKREVPRWWKLSLTMERHRLRRVEALLSYGEGEEAQSVRKSRMEMKKRVRRCDRMSKGLNFVHFGRWGFGRHGGWLRSTHTLPWWHLYPTLD